MTNPIARLHQDYLTAAGRGGAELRTASRLVAAAVDGEGWLLTFADGLSAPGKYVELRAEMEVLVLVSNCPQLNNPCNAYNPTPARFVIWDPVTAS